MLSIMRITVRQPSEVYPTFNRLMSWQAPHRLTTACLPGPSGKSDPGCCARAGKVEQSRAAADTAKGRNDMRFSRSVGAIIAPDPHRKPGAAQCFCPAFALAGARLLP